MANFTDEQIAQLSGNQNVQWVSKTGVQFTPEFKLLAWEQKQQGRRMKDIFRDNGIDPDILGRKRIDTELQLKSFTKSFRAYLKTKYSCTISTKSKWKQDGQKQERTRRACHSE